MPDKILCKYCGKTFEYFDILEHECKVARYELTNTIIDLVEKLSRAKSSKQIENEEVYLEMVDKLTEIYGMIKKHMKRVDD